MAIASDMSKNISDPQKTYHGFPELGREKPEWATKTGKSEIQPTVKAGNSERQQTDVCDHIQNDYLLFYCKFTQYGIMYSFSYSHFSYYFSLNSKFRSNIMWEVVVSKWEGLWSTACNLTSNCTTVYYCYLAIHVLYVSKVYLATSYLWDEPTVPHTDFT